jgi:hypothetical protein
LILACLLCLAGWLFASQHRINPLGNAKLEAGKPIEISGVAGANDCLNILDGDKVLGTTNADANGNWKFSLPATLASGAHKIYAKLNGTCSNTMRVAGGEWGPLDVNLAAPAAAVVAAAPTAAPAPTVAPTAAPTAVPINNIVPVAPSVLNLKEGDKFDTGKAPVINGMAAPNAKLKIFDGDKLICETTADKDGKWSCDASKLADGAHRLIVQQVDDKGNVVSAAYPLGFNVGSATATAAVTSTTTVTPTATAVATTIADLGKDPLAIGAMIKGTCGKDCNITIMDGAKEIGTVKAEANGTWSFKLPVSLAPGNHALKAICKDASGKVINESAIANIVIAVPLPVTGGQL